MPIVSGQIAGVLDRLAVDLGDDVAGFAGPRRRQAFPTSSDRRWPRSRLVSPMACGDVRADRLNPDAEIAVPDHAAVLELVHDLLDRARRNGEADAHASARGRIDGCVHADDLTLLVEGRPAGIALVDRGVDLQEPVVRAVADVAALRREDAGRDGVAETVRIADRDDPVADPGRPHWRTTHRGSSPACSTFRSARSVFGSVPTTLASSVRPSSIVTVTDFASCTTWLLVTM